MELLFLIGRVVFGGYFVLQGINHFKNVNSLSGYAASKSLPSPKASVYLSGLMLVLGGLAVLTGVYYTIGLWLLIIFLVAAAFLMHTFWKVAPEARSSEKIQFEKNLALAGAALMLASLPAEWVYVLMF